MSVSGRLPHIVLFFFPKESSLVEQSVSMRCCVFDKCQSKRCFCSFCNHANNKLLTQFLHFILTTNAMTWANFVFLGYKHFLQMFIYQRCLSACGQIGAVLENEVRKIFCCSCKSCLSILLMFLKAVLINSQLLLARLVQAMAQYEIIHPKSEWF